MVNESEEPAVSRGNDKLANVQIQKIMKQPPMASELLKEH